MPRRVRSSYFTVVLKDKTEIDFKEQCNIICGINDPTVQFVHRMRDSSRTVDLAMIPRENISYIYRYPMDNIEEEYRE